MEINNFLIIIVGSLERTQIIRNTTVIITFFFKIFNCEKLNFKIYPGTIGKHILIHGIGIRNVPKSERNYQKYYQWVVPMLVFQAVMLYSPTYLWRIWEGGIMQALCGKFSSPVNTDNWNEGSKKLIVKYLTENTDHHKAYAIRFIICELLNYMIGVNTKFLLIFFKFYSEISTIQILNIAFINFVFTGFWLRFTPAMMTLVTTDWKSWEAYSSRIFPKLVKCDLDVYGPSGSYESKDALCVLPLNIINDKIFAFLWIWFIILFAISTVNLLYRLVILFSRKYRIIVLKSLARPISFKQAKRASHNGNYGDWFVLWLMSMNLNPEIFKDIMFDLNELLATKTMP